MGYIIERGNLNDDYIHIYDVLIFSIIVVFIFFSFYIHIISFGGFIIGAVYSLLNNRKKDICLLMFILPYAEIFNFSMGTTSFFTLLEFILLFKIFAERKDIERKYILFIMEFTLYVCFASIISSHIGFLKLIKLFMSLTILWDFIDIYEAKDFRDYVFCYSFGLSIASIIGMSKSYIPGFAVLYNDMNSQWIDGVQINRYSATFSDPNYYSIAVIVGIGMIITLIANEGIRIWSVIFCVLLIIFGCLTYSKSFYLILVVLLFAVLLILIQQKKYIYFVAIVTIISVLFIGGGIFKFPITQRIIYRFNTESESVSDITTGRTDIWSNYFAYIKSNARIFLFGDGIGAKYLYGAAHNIYVETWYHVGIVGFCSYILTLIGTFSHRKLIRRTVTNYFLVLCVAIMYAFLCGFTGFEFPFYMISCWIVLNTTMNPHNIKVY